MKRYVCTPLEPPYSLHDMTLCALEAEGDSLTLRSQTGLLRLGNPVEQVDGHVELEGLCWEQSFVTLLPPEGKPGPFAGERLLLRDFMARALPLGFSVLEESLGRELTLLSGFVSVDAVLYEAQLELRHQGPLTFVEDD